jgi:protein required for attachment to host cells
VASALEHMVRREKVKAIIIVAPPRTLELRNALHADVKSRIVAEIDRT